MGTSHVPTPFKNEQYMGTSHVPTPFKNEQCMGTSHVPTVKPANHLLYFQRRDVNMKITKVGLPVPIIVHVH